jgi:peptide/nickel transport system substrate-binding protein
MIARRSLLGGSAGAFLLAALATRSLARGRSQYGGSLALQVPWPVMTIDPHRIDDSAAALFGDALFDTLYAPGEGDAFLARLAESDPQPDGRTLRVKLRTGVAFGSGAHLDARAAALSLARSRSADAAAWLADVPAPRADGDTLVFATSDARNLVRTLASPLLAIVSPRFSPERPDGTGPFRAAPQPLGLTLTRNTLAACGPSLLDSIDVRRAPDLAASLRAFESGADDVGWLGSFLHEPRQGARPFDAGAVAWAILRTGRDAGNLDAPGSAQALADGVPHSALAALVVGAPWKQGSAQWSGAPCDLVVRDDAPWLVEVAQALAVALSAPSHEVVARPIPRLELAQRRAARSFGLMLDIARPAGPGELGTLIGLAIANDPSTALGLARHPPRGEVSPRTATRTMRIGVVGEVRVQGGRAPGVVLPSSAWGRGVDWGAAWRARS